MTCISCRMSFLNSKEQREHYKTDLHRFNLKRKVAELPPVTLEVFQQKVETTPSTSTPTTTQKNQPTRAGSDFKCGMCRKTFSSENAMLTHHKSKKHRDNLKNEEVKSAAHAGNQSPDDSQPMDESSSPQNSQDIQPADSSNTTSNDMKDEEATTAVSLDNMTDEERYEHHIKTARRFTLEECLFCRNKCSNLESNMEHMASVHGFFVPDVEYLSDLEGLIKYLGELIAVGYMCLHCGDKSRFNSVKAAQNHMTDMNHCKFSYEGNEAEFEDFYDFSRDYEKTEDGQIVLHKKELDPNIIVTDAGTYHWRGKEDHWTSFSSSILSTELQA